jgi:hypothetical protein
MKLIMINALILGIVASVEPAERPYLDAALRAARWIESSSLRTAKGTAWPSDPRDPKTVETNLHSGVPGVVLFFLETLSVDSVVKKMICSPQLIRLRNASGKRVGS